MPDGEIISQNFEYPITAGMPISGQYRLIDEADAPTAGKWMRWPFAKGSFEAIGTFTGSIELLLSQAPTMPPNGSTVTIGGTATAGNVLSLMLTVGMLTVLGQYTVLGGDTLDDIAAGLAAALQAELVAKAQYLSNPEDIVALAGSFVATSNLAVITLLTHQPTPPVSITFDDGGGTATATIADYDDGEGQVVSTCTMTAPGAVYFEAVAQWIKAKVTALSAGAVTGIVNGSAP